MNALQMPPVGTARLPRTYEAAKQALAECTSLDECKDWSDKAAALASYARQAEDKTLERYAVRIRARAVRRAGELLKQIDGRGKSGDASTFTQRDAAADAGMSKDQQVQAVRLANVPGEDFDVQLDGNNPPTITALAEQGKKSVVIDHRDGMSTEVFQAGIHGRGRVRDLAEYAETMSPQMIADGTKEWATAEFLADVNALCAWLDRLAVALEHK